MFFLVTLIWHEQYYNNTIYYKNKHIYVLQRFLKFLFDLCSFI